MPNRLVPFGVSVSFPVFEEKTGTRFLNIT